MQPPSLTRLLKLANIILGPITLNCLAFILFYFFFALFREQLYGTVPSLTSLECSSSHDVYFCDSFAASLCVKNELELEYKDRATLLVTQTLQVVQGRTPNHLDLLNLKWTLVCRNPSSWSSSYREGARERYQAYNRPSEKRVRTKHGPGVHGTTLWTRSMDRVHGPPVMDRVILGDPGAVSRAGRKGATKVFKHRRKSPWVPTLTGPFPKGQANSGSWLGTKNALYYFAQSANSFSWVLFVSSYTTAIISPQLPGSFTKLS